MHNKSPSLLLLRFLQVFISLSKLLLLRFLLLRDIRFDFITLVHPFSLIRTTGRNSKVSIGRLTCIRDLVEIHAHGAEIRISENVFINRGSMVVSHEKITIERNVTISPGVYIYDHDHNFRKNVASERSDFITSPIFIGSNCWIGAGVIILKGCHIGEGCIIGAGSIISGNIPANSIVKQDRITSIKAINVASRGT